MLPYLLFSENIMAGSIHQHLSGEIDGTFHDPVL